MSHTERHQCQQCTRTTSSTTWHMLEQTSVQSSTAAGTVKERCCIRPAHLCATNTSENHLPQPHYTSSNHMTHMMPRPSAGRFLCAHHSVAMSPICMSRADNTSSPHASLRCGSGPDQSTTKCSNILVRYTMLYMYISPHPAQRASINASGSSACCWVTVPSAFCNVSSTSAQNPHVLLNACFSVVSTRTCHELDPSCSGPSKRCTSSAVSGTGWLLANNSLAASSKHAAAPRDTYTSATHTQGACLLQATSYCSSLSTYHGQHFP